MTKTIFKLVALAWFGLLLSGCSRTHSELGGDSSTHWLLSCKHDAQCGGLSCVCGVCSKECSRADQCSALGASASCVPSADGCGGVQLCDRECDISEDCASSSLECSEARCRLSGPPDRSEASAPMSQPDGASPVAPMSDASAAGPQTSDAGGGPPGACAPQRAAWDGTECMRPLGFSWNGATCEEVVCGCQGPDCASLFPSEQACELAYATCLNPATQCSGLPWYRCFDHCPGDLHLIGGSRSSGECSGDCSFTLSFEPPPASSGSCLSVRGELRVDNTQLPARAIRFELSDVAVEELMLLSRAIEGLSLAPPDCSECIPDQASHTILRRDGESATGVVFSYPAKRPPIELRAVDRFIQSLIDQANACRGDKLLSCSE